MSEIPEMQETEVTLGTGKLLGVFFGLAVVCAVFFGLGFALGRNTTSAANTVQADASTAAPVIQPAAARTTAPATPCSDPGCDAAKDTASHELAFLKTAEKDPPPPDPAAVVSETRAREKAPAPVVKAPSAPVAARPAHVVKTGPAPQAGFVAQVAAVRRHEDAETLVSALRKKSYPVFIASESGDRLFHVQVGPFADRKDAQTMKDKLSGDGYNSLVK